MNKDELKRRKATIRQIKYRATPRGRKSQRVFDWKRRGVKGDLDKIYEEFLKQTNCEMCNCKLTTDDKIRRATTRVLDHNHDTGDFRFILCHSCNIRFR
jgi:hypothetical protein